VRRGISGTIIAEPQPKDPGYDGVAVGVDLDRTHNTAAERTVAAQRLGQVPRRSGRRQRFRTHPWTSRRSGVGVVPRNDCCRISETGRARIKSGGNVPF
jgi:hypothetical protein